MKLVSVKPNFSLYLKESGDYAVSVYDQSQKIVFDLGMTQKVIDLQLLFLIQTMTITQTD